MIVTVFILIALAVVIWGVISFQRQCVNQHGSVVQEMKATLMYKRRPKE